MDSELTSEALEVLLEDWKQKASEIQFRVDQQAKLQSYALTYSAAILAFAAALTIASDGRPALWFAPQVFLFAPLGFAMLALAFSDQDFMICTLATYVQAHIVPRLEKAACANGICGWEQHLGDARVKRNKSVAGRLMSNAKYLLFVVPSILCLIFYVDIQFQQTLAPWAAAASPWCVGGLVLLALGVSFSNGERLLITIPHRATVSKEGVDPKRRKAK